MVVYRMTDRIPVKIGELTFLLAPLNVAQKARLLASVQNVAGVQNEDAFSKASLAIRMSVKEVEGVKCADGSDWVTELGPDGELTDDCLSEIMQVTQNADLVQVCLAFGLNRIEDPGLPGIEIDLKGVRSVKKK